MPSIASWTRLEPQTRSEGMETSLQARVHDPLWLLARQWQMGEFKGEDAGSPVTVRLRAECARLSRYHPGPLAADAASSAKPYDSRRLPLETLVEREPIRRRNEPRLNPRLSAEAGLQFLRYIKVNGAGKYRSDYVKHYPLEPPTDQEQESFDKESLRFLKIMARRAPDGMRLYDDLQAALRPSGGGRGLLPPEPVIDAGDRPKVTAAAEAWMDWFESLFSEPEQGSSTWDPERMEYEFAVSARTADGELVLVAPEYMEGHLDWYAFNFRPGAALGTDQSDPDPEQITRTVIPARVSYRGMPASRWWEFEDAQVDFGAVEAGSKDLARLLLIAFATVFGNDWFVIPVDMEVGSICRIRSLVVTDTFGQRTLIRHYSEEDGPGSPWHMFCAGLDRRVDPGGITHQSNVFFLPPVLATSLQSPPVEEVLFLRDEMANLGWAVERIVESPIGKPLNQFEAFQEKRQSEKGREKTAAPETGAVLLYRLAGSVPDYWIPLVPVPVRQTDGGSIRLRRGRMLFSETAQLAEKPGSRILEPGRRLSLYEEEVPRAGARVRRAYQYTRWIDGSTHLWIGRHKQPGRGEGWSGLRFDIVE